MSEQWAGPLRADGAGLRDAYGRLRILHGVSLVEKGTTGAADPQAFRGTWTEYDLRRLADQGLTFVRLGFIWAAVEPEPGRYDADYLEWLAEQVDALHQAGLLVILDAHQDLYSQSYSDGAPSWATLSTESFQPSKLWSDGYLSSPAVQQSLDAFWDNALGPGQIGLQDRFAAMWQVIARRFADHPAVIGYDLWNEPAPGTESADILGAVFEAAATATGMSVGSLVAEWDDSLQRSKLLDLLNDAEIHRSIGDAAAGHVAAFDQQRVAPLMARVAGVVRSADPDAVLLREHSYFANLGIPSGQPPLDDPNWAYSPHGYDLTVDTPDVDRPSDVRAETIFSRHAETARRLSVPVIVGEWGGFGGHSAAAAHGRFLMDLFDRLGWGWAYWCWYPGFTDTWEEDLLSRPRPLAIAGDDPVWAVDGDRFTASWTGRQAEAPSQFWLPAGYTAVDVSRDGRPVAVRQQGRRIAVPADTGSFNLTATRDVR